MTAVTRAAPGSLCALAALCSLICVSACAGARPASGPPPEYPGALTEPDALRSPSALGPAFALEQRVRTEYPEGAQEFRAVLQLRGDTLLLVGFGPHGGRGFVLTQEGEDVRFESHLPQELPFPPEFMLQDVQRAWFLGLDAPPTDGERTELHEGEERTERWAGGRLMERTFRRVDGQPEGVIRIQYGDAGLGGDTPPEQVTVDNGWFGYRLVLTTLSHQRLPPEDEAASAPESEAQSAPEASPESDADGEPRGDTDADASADDDTEAGADDDTEPGADDDTEPGAETGADAEPAAHSGADPQARIAPPPASTRESPERAVASILRPDFVHRPARRRPPRVLCGLAEMSRRRRAQRRRP